MRSKVFAVIKREYGTRARTKGFIIGTLIIPLVFVLMGGGVFLFRSFFQPSTRVYAVIDQSDRIFDQFIGLFPDTLRTGEPEYRFENVQLVSGSIDEITRSLQERVLQQEIDGYINIPENIAQSREVTFSARNVGDYEMLRDFSRALSRIVADMRLELAGYSAERVRSEIASGRVNMVSRQVTNEGEIEKGGVPSFILAYILTYLILIMMMVYGQTLMRSVIEEKTQRITETIISAVKPIELMVGKIIGICGLGLTQLVVVGLIFYAVATYGEPLLSNMGMRTSDVLDILRQVKFTPSLFGFMIVFFLLGYIFFSSLFAAVGAMVNTEDEGQQYQMPLVFIILIGYFIMFTVARNPDTPRAFWISLFPVFTPIVSFARVAVSDPVIPQGTFLSIFTLATSTVILVFMVAKIYRVGILMYGKKPSLKEALRWLRYR